METKELLKEYVRNLEEENKMLKEELHTYTSRIRYVDSHINCVRFNKYNVDYNNEGYVKLCCVLNDYLTKNYNDYVYETDFRSLANNKAVLKKYIKDLQKENAELKKYTFICKDKINLALKYISEEHNEFYDDECDFYYIDKFYKQVEEILSNLDIPYLFYIA